MKRIVSILLAVLIILVVAPLSLAATYNESESNDSFTSANSISVNNTIKGNLSSSSDNDYFKFTLSSDGYISFSFSHDRLDDGSTYWRLYLYNASQQEYMYRSFSGNETSVTTANIGLPQGTYYVKISDYYYSNIYYNFKVNYTSSSIWETEQNNSFANADSINVNKNYYGSIINSDDNDYYKFTTSSDGYVSLTFNHDRLDDGSTYWVMYLYNASQQEYMTRSFSGNVPTVTTANIGIPAGTYYVKIDDYYNSDINYNFIVNFKSSSTWETEQNNAFSTADTINLNTIYYGSIINSSDNDYYKFTTTSDGYVSVTFNHDRLDDGSTYWVMYLYNASQEEYLYRTFSGNVSTQTTANIGIPAGTYYLRIDDYYNSDINYSFIINYTSSTSWETEKNDVFSAADIISVNKSVTGSITNDYDKDYYKFSLNSSDSISVTLEHERLDSSSGYWTVTIYNENQEEQKSYNFYGNKTSETSEKFSLSKGTYYARVTDWYYSDIDYSLAINSSSLPVSYTVTYNPNGGSISPTSATVTSGNSVTLPIPTKSYKITYNANNGTGAPSVQTVNLTCKGWATSSTATSANYNCGVSYKPTGNVTLYAVWTSSVSATLSSTKPTRSGYSFLGWSTSSSATSATYNAGGSISLDGNKTLYAVWKADPAPTTYTLSYNANGGSGAPSSQSGNGAITLSSARPTRSGYTFLGWSTSSSATVATYTPGASFNLTSNTTLYAVWTSNPPATNDPSIQIRNYIPRREEAYRTTITFTAEVLNAPAGATAHWYLNGQEVYIGDQYTVSQAASDYSIQVKLVSSGGSILAESNIENVAIKNSFFARLIAFFRTLFGSLPVISQSIEEII